MSCGCTTLNTKLNFVIVNTLFIYDKEEDDKEEDDKEEDDKEEDDKEENEENVKLVHRTIKKMMIKKMMIKKILTNVQIATMTSLSSHKYATPRTCRVCTNCNRCTNHYCICQSKTYIN